MKRKRRVFPQPVKKISDETLLGQKGMNMAERVVLEMGFIWNPIHIESGVDAYIEIRDPASGQTKNRILQAQVKAVSRFAAEQDDAFSFSCERAHISYWRGGTAPVILIVCKPATNEMYWKDLKQYFSVPENRDRCTVRFSKKEDRFELSSTYALLSVAKPQGGLALGALPKIEKLTTNLFLLSGYPAEIIATKTKAADWNTFFEDLKTKQKPWVREFVWKAGLLYSFFDPNAEGIGDLGDSNLAPIPTSQWEQSNDPIIQRYFAELLGRTFEAFCYRRGIALRRDTGMFYFTAPIDGGERTIATKSLVNVTSKTVVSRHPSIREDGTATVYYKHFAFEGRMRRFDARWFFELTPTYYFSGDGVSPYPYADALLAGIKRMERHQAVLGTFLTWKEFLTEDSLFNSSYRYLRINAPESVTLDRGIDDSAWQRGRTPEETTAEPDIEHDASEPDAHDDDSLFSWKPN